MTDTYLIQKCIFTALIMRQQKMFKNPKMTINIVQLFFSPLVIQLSIFKNISYLCYRFLASPRTDPRMRSAIFSPEIPVTPVGYVTFTYSTAHKSGVVFLWS